MFVLATATALWTYAKMKSGAMHSPLYTLFGWKKPQTETYGYVKEGYEEAFEVFKKLLDDGMEENAQACAYVDGEIVLDVVGVVNRNDALSENYNASTIQNVFSSSKVVSSIVVAMLVDRGHLRYDMKVCEIWPEFGCYGKETITIEEVVKHEAGMEKFPFSLSAHELSRENLKDRSSQVCTKIAGIESNRSALKSDKSGHPRAYHAVTRDFIVNEVVMRADPHGRTIGEFMRDEISSPLGLRGELTIGSETTQNAHNIQPLRKNSLIWVLLQLFNRINPRLDVGQCIMQLFLMNMGLGYKIASLVLGKNYALPSLVAGEGMDPYMEVTELFNHPSVRNCEAPSANMHASARALAKVAAVMAGQGSAHGVTLMSPETVEKSHEVNDEDIKMDSVLNAQTKFNRGGWNVFDSDRIAHHRFGMVGWFGIGGSVMMWHRNMNIGFGWANSLMVPDISGPNAAAVQNAITLCAMRKSR